jgi:hypothetical protein
MPGWNPKVQRIWPEDEVFDPRRVYDVKYAMSGRTSDFKARAVDFAPASRIVIDYEPVGTAEMPLKARESFELEPVPEGTRVTHRVMAEEKGIPLWARGLIWLISKVGKRRGEHPLQAYLSRAG